MYGVFLFGDRMYYMFGFGELLFFRIGRIFIEFKLKFLVKFENNFGIFCYFEIEFILFSGMC